MLGLVLLGAVFLAGAVALGKGEAASSSLWWPLFATTIVSGFMWQFGRRGAGTLSESLVVFAASATFILWVLIFVLVGWKGGVAAILGGFGGGFLGTAAMGLLRGRIEL